MNAKKGRLLSIITPTYNRGHLLKRCFESLVSQTSKKFEWIIVDDGSEDATTEIVKKFKKEMVDFSIQYIKKENGGKHTALNESHKYIHGDYVLILDSDDYLTDNAVETVLEGWKKYENDNRIGMVVYLKGITENDPVAYAKDEDTPVDVLRYKRVCVSGSDCCEVIRSQTFLKFPFPIFSGERFMAETVLWYRVGLEQKCIYVNRVIYICEYLEDGLTRTGREMRIKNPYGGMMNSELAMDKRNFLKQRVKNGLLFVCYGFFANLSVNKIIKYTENYRGLKLVCILPGYLMYRLWKSKYM